jgi:hypothetical protein
MGEKKMAYTMWVSLQNVHMPRYEGRWKMTHIYLYTHLCIYAYMYIRMYMYIGVHIYIQNCEMNASIVVKRLNGSTQPLGCVHMLEKVMTGDGAAIIPAVYTYNICAVASNERKRRK